MTWWTRCRLSFLLVALAPVVAWSAPAVPPAVKEKVKEAQSQYDLGHFDDSLRLFSEAYEMKPLPGILFNIAQCHRHLGNWERASFFYRRFLSLAGKRVKNAGETQEFIKEMDAKQDEAKKKQEEQELAERQRRELELARLHGQPAPDSTGATTPPVTPPTTPPNSSATAPPKPVASDAPTETGFVPNPPPPLLSSTPATPAGQTETEVAPSESIFSKWWFWTAVGGVVAAGAGAGIYAATRPKAPVCTASLGCN